PPLYELDFDGTGFEWLDCNDATQSVVSYLRKSKNGFVVVVLNFTPVVRHGYRIGVPVTGDYRELLNSDAGLYGGSNVGNAGQVRARDESWMGRPAMLELTLPPLAGVVLELVDSQG
ncbi:MAG TPA: 1,4-alpha-glucan branching enzyme, partial [Desulfobacterales bacterium]|nr:1,4-alpha-glucan branching enzyme [Desulfobacterales bacterium]